MFVFGGGNYEVLLAPFGPGEKIFAFVTVTGFTTSNRIDQNLATLTLAGS